MLSFGCTAPSGTWCRACPLHLAMAPIALRDTALPRCHFMLEMINLFTTYFWPLWSVCDIPEALIQACCPKQIHNLFKRRLSPLGVAVKPVLLTRPLMCTCLYARSSLSLCSVDLSSSTRDFYMRKESIRGCTNPRQSCLQRTALEGKTTFLFFCICS